MTTIKMAQVVCWFAPSLQFHASEPSRVRVPSWDEVQRRPTRVGHVDNTSDIRSLRVEVGCDTLLLIAGTSSEEAIARIDEHLASGRRSSTTMTGHIRLLPPRIL
jgi:hypothetical protein